MYLRVKDGWVAEQKILHVIEEYLIFFLRRTHKIQQMMRTFLPLQSHQCVSWKPV